MPTSRVRAAARTGRVLSGLGALIVLILLLIGGPVALLAFAGNPLPDQVPTLTQVTEALTARDDGRLFVNALAIVGWLGWATFALSVLVELPARVLRRPAVRIPGLGRQQRAAAALIGSVVLMLAASPAAAATAAAIAPAVAAAPPTPATAAALSHQASVVDKDRPAGTGGLAAAQSALAPAGLPPGPAGSQSATTQSAPAAAQFAAVGATRDPATAPLVSPAALAHLARTGPAAPEPVYRVEQGDYLGAIADRYLGDFERYRDLAKLNEIADPDQIKPGELLHLPETAEDRGVRQHATGLVAIPPPGTAADQAPPAAPPTGPAQPAPAPPSVEAPPVEQPSAEQPRHQPGSGITYAAGASRAGQVDTLNRPLAVSAVIAVASMFGAQIGALLGLRRRPVRAGVVEGGRHRR